MTDIELQAVREHVYSVWDYMPRSEMWRAIELKNDIDRLLAYVRRLQEGPTHKRAGFRSQETGD